MSDNNLFEIYNSPDVLAVKFNHAMDSVKTVYNCSSAIGQALINIGKHYVSLNLNLCIALGKIGKDAQFLAIYNEDGVNLYNAVVNQLNNGLSSINQLFDSLNIPLNTNLFEKSFYNNKTFVDNIETICSLLKTVVATIKDILNIGAEGFTAYSSSLKEINKLLNSLGSELHLYDPLGVFDQSTPLDDIKYMQFLMNIVCDIMESSLEVLGLLSSILLDFPISEISLQWLILYSTVSSDIKQQCLLLSTKADGLKFNELNTQMTNKIRSCLENWGGFLFGYNGASEATKESYKKALGDLNIFYEDFAKTGDIKTFIMRCIISGY